MNQNVTIIYFSPTGTTATIMREIAGGLPGDSFTEIDVTSRMQRERSFSPGSDELVIIGMPVYAGRIPETVVPFLKRMKAENTPAVPVVVYGNRDYDDALLELHDLMEEAGFRIIAAGTFIGEHSYSRKDAPIATGRPDKDDIQKARELGKIIAGKMEPGTGVPLDLESALPGNRPYRERMQFPPVVIPVDRESCTGCDICVEACPVDAINPVDYEQDPEKCIICCACIKRCPENARSLHSELISSVTEKISRTCAERKEPEIYL